MCVKYHCCIRRCVTSSMMLQCIAAPVSESCSWRTILFYIISKMVCLEYFYFDLCTVCSGACLSGWQVVSRLRCVGEVYTNIVIVQDAVIGVALCIASTAII